MCWSDYLLISKHLDSPMGERGQNNCAVNGKSWQPPVDGVSVSFFLQEGVGTLTCLPSKEMDIPGRSLSLRYEFSGNRESDSTNSPRITDCLVFCGTWVVREEKGCWTCWTCPNGEESKLATKEGSESCCWRAVDADGGGDCEGCKAETPWLEVFDQEYGR